MAPSTKSQGRQREPKAPANYRAWTGFDPYSENVGCAIRVARRPSSLVAPPRVSQSSKRGIPVNPQASEASTSIHATESVASRERMHVAALLPGAPSSRFSSKPPPAGPISLLPTSHQACMSSNACAHDLNGCDSRHHSTNGCGSIRSIDKDQYEGQRGAIFAEPQRVSQLATGIGQMGIAPTDGYFTENAAAAALSESHAAPLVAATAECHTLPGRASTSAPSDGPNRGYQPADMPSTSIASNMLAAACDDRLNMVAPPDPLLSKPLEAQPGETLASYLPARSISPPYHTPAPPPSAIAGIETTTRAPSLLQLEELDTLLQDHQHQLRRRVEQMRRDKQRQHEEWYRDIQQIIPTPQRRSARAVAHARHAACHASSNTQPAARRAPELLHSTSSASGSSPHRTVPQSPPRRQEADRDAGRSPSHLPSPPIASITPPRSRMLPSPVPEPAPFGSSISRMHKAVDTTSPQRTSLESLEELEALLEDQHNELIARGFIGPEHAWLPA